MLNLQPNYNTKPPSWQLPEGGGIWMKRRPKKLLDQVREAIHLKHYPIRTEEAYVNWVKRFILSYLNSLISLIPKMNPLDFPFLINPLDTSSITNATPGRWACPKSRLTHLAVDLKVAASTQNMDSILSRVQRIGQWWN
jgi:hypothetical protein